MLLVDNENVNDPHLNLALEEHLLRSAAPDQDILLFYINESSIIIGRNQNTVEEINHEFVRQRGIHVVRRLSGGGAVYHDLGNLNFSFITINARENIQNFRKFTAPVIQVLSSLGVPAELGGRNDILVAGRKISGNAQYVAGQRMVSHGTLLYDSDLSMVAEALRVKQTKIESKGSKSVRSRVANIREFMPEPMDVLTFRQHLLEGIFQGGERVQEYHLTPQDWEAARTLAEERYRSWEWNFGRSPAFNVHKSQRFPVGEIETKIDVNQGSIQAIKFYGDFLGHGEVSDLEELLTGIRYDPEALQEALKEVDIQLYFGELALEDLVSLLY
jgi:lipoate---protein ligase